MTASTNKTLSTLPPPSFPCLVKSRAAKRTNTMSILTKKVTLYEGFVIPEKDAQELKLNGFQYDTDDECFKGMLETEEGELRNYNYYPTNYLWFSVEDLGEDDY